jgi:hypothetical protein
MADPPRYPKTSDDTEVQREPGSMRGTPRRTKVLLVVIGVALLMVMVALHLAGVTPH